MTIKYEAKVKGTIQFERVLTIHAEDKDAAKEGAMQLIQTATYPSDKLSLDSIEVELPKFDVELFNEDDSYAVTTKEKADA